MGEIAETRWEYDARRLPRDRCGELSRSYTRDSDDGSKLTVCDELWGDVNATGGRYTKAD